MSNSQRNRQTKPYWIWLLIGLATVCSIFVAVGHPSEYVFYTITRWLVSSAAVVNVALLANYKKTPSLVVLSCIVAFLFNPIFPFYLGRELWVVLDFIAPVVLIVGGTIIMTTNRDDLEDIVRDE